MTVGRPGPSWAWYLVPAGLVVAAVVGGIVLMVVGVVRFDERIDDLQRVDIPGTGTVTFLDDGGYTAYYEIPSREWDEDFEPPTLSIDVEPIDPAPPVRVGDYDTSFTYDNGGRHGEAVATLRIPEPGRYEITVVDVSERGDDDAQLAVGHSVGDSILAGFLYGGGAMAAGVFVAGMLVLLIALRRIKAKADSEPSYT